jgi:moderate conductance mechanosensitive channel
MDWDSFFHTTLVQILSIILGTVVLQVVSRKIITRVVRRAVRSNRYETRLDERKREDTLINIFRTSVAAILWIIAGFSILLMVGINLASLATGAGLISVVIGLGAQTTIRDILAGIFILFENQYRVGDRISLNGGMTGANGASGVVEEISLRITKLRGDDGTLSIVRNGEAAVITNRSFKYSNVIVDLAIGLDADIDKLEKVINDVGQTMASEEQFEKAILNPIAFQRIDAFTDKTMAIRAVGKVRPGQQLELAGEYRRRLLPALKQAKIKLHKTPEDA